MPLKRPARNLISLKLSLFYILLQTGQLRNQTKPGDILFVCIIGVRSVAGFDKLWEYRDILSVYEYTFSNIKEENSKVSYVLPSQFGS